MKVAWLTVLALALGCRKVERARPPAPHGAPDMPAHATAEAPLRIAGPPEVLVREQALPVDLALDDDAIYWTNFGRIGIASGSVMKLPKRGGEPVVLADFETQPAALALDDQFVYWTTTSDGAIRRVAKAGGPVVSLFVSGGHPEGIAVDGEAIYFSDEARGTVSKLAKAGGPPRILASEQRLPLAIALDGADVYWANAGGLGGHTGAVMRWRGGKVTALAGGLGTPRGLVLDGGDLFVSVRVPDPAQAAASRGLIGASELPELWRIEKHGGAVQVLVHGQAADAPLAVDRSHLYFTQRTGLTEGGSLHRIPRRGGSLELVAPRTPPVGALAVDGTGVYFVSDGLITFHAGAIARVALAPP